MASTFTDTFERTADVLPAPWQAVVGRIRTTAGEAGLASTDALSVVDLGVPWQRPVARYTAVTGEDQTSRGVVAKYDLTKGTYYVADHIGADLRIRSWRNQWVEHATIPGVHLPGDHTLELAVEQSAQGVTLAVWLDGVMVRQVTDASPLSGTGAGFMMADSTQSVTVESVTLVDVQGIGVPLPGQGAALGAGLGGTDATGARNVITGPVASIDGTAASHLVTLGQLNTVRGVARGFATTIGNGTDSTFVIRHGLGTYDVLAEVLEVGGSRQSVWPVITRPTIDSIVLDFDGFVPGVGAMRVMAFSVPGVSSVQDPVVDPGGGTGPPPEPTPVVKPDPVRLGFLGTRRFAGGSGLKWLALRPDEVALRDAAKASGAVVLARVRADGTKAGAQDSVTPHATGWPTGQTSPDGYVLQDPASVAWQDYFAQQLAVIAAGWDGIFLDAIPTGDAGTAFLTRVTTAYVGRLEALVTTATSAAALTALDGAAWDVSANDQAPALEAAMASIEAASASGRSTVLRMRDTAKSGPRNTFGLGLSLLVTNSKHAYRYQVDSISGVEKAKSPATGTGPLVGGQTYVGGWSRVNGVIKASSGLVSKHCWEYGGGAVGIEATVVSLPTTPAERAGFVLASGGSVPRQYECLIDTWGAVRLRRRWDGDATLNGSWADFSSAGQAVKGGDKLTFTHDGKGLIQGMVNGVVVVSVQDNSPIDGNWGGLFTYDSTGTAGFGDVTLATIEDQSGNVYTEDWTTLRALGDPTGSRTKTGAVWRRPFQGGTLNVDMTARSVSIT